MRPTPHRKCTSPQLEVAAAQELFERAEANKDKQKRGPKPKECNSINFIETTPNSNGAVLRRLARDQPELLDKIELGELTVNQAAIQAI